MCEEYLRPVECVDGVAGRGDFLFGLDYFRGSGAAVWLCVVLELQAGVEVPVALALALALATEGLAARGRRRFQGRDTDGGNGGWRVIVGGKVGDVGDGRG